MLTLQSLHQSLLIFWKVKKLNTAGNLFGSDFSFAWEKNFTNPNITTGDIKFKNPNLNILSTFNKDSENFTKAKTNIKFLRNSLDLNYKYNSYIIIY